LWLEQVEHKYRLQGNGGGWRQEKDIRIEMMEENNNQYDSFPDTVMITVFSLGFLSSLTC
jgi:hypothetical protein